MSEGRDFIISISSDGTSGGTPTEIEFQGDLQMNFGNSIQTTVYKNGQNTNHNDAGKTVSFSIGVVAPVATAHALLLALDESRDSSYFWINNAKTGGLEFEFAAKAAISGLNSPVNGDNVANVELGIEGTWTRGAAA